MAALVSPHLWIFILLVALIRPYERADDRRRMVMACLLLNLFTLFFGLRGATGHDYASYQWYYQEVLSDGGNWNVEPAFTALSLLFRWLHLPYQYLVFVCACIINLLLFRFIWQQKMNVPLVLTVYWAMSGIINQVDFLRSTIAMLLFANALPYLVRRDARRYYAVVTLACLFHYAAVLFLPLYFLLHRCLPRRHYAYVVALLNVLLVLRLPLLNLPFAMQTAEEGSLLAHYQTYVTTYGGLRLGFSLAAMERLLTATGVLMLYKPLTSDVWGRVAVSGFLMFYLCYTLLSGYAVLATRLANMFVWSYWLLWPMLLQHFGSCRARRTAFCVIAVYMAARVWSVAQMPEMAYVTCFSQT